MNIEINNSKQLIFFNLRDDKECIVVLKMQKIEYYAIINNDNKIKPA